MPAVYALSAFVMTLAGGAFAFRYQRYLLYIMAFSSGLVIGVAFLDLIPEVTEAAFHEGIPIRALMVTVVIGFLAIFLLEKLTIIHSEKQHDAPGHHHNVGLVGAIGLSFHSFLDGLAIGVGFEAGPKVGLVVLLAVVAHDFADGLNTVTFMLALEWRLTILTLIILPLFIIPAKRMGPMDDVSTRSDPKRAGRRGRPGCGRLASGQPVDSSFAGAGHRYGRCL